MRKKSGVVKRIGAILLAVCLLATSGCFSDLASVFGQQLKSRITAKAEGEEWETWNEYPLYNFTKLYYFDKDGKKQLIKDANGKDAFFRLNRTTIRTKYDYSHYDNEKHNIENKNLEFADYYIAPGDSPLPEVITGTRKYVNSNGEESGYDNDGWNYVYVEKYTPDLAAALEAGKQDQTKAWNKGHNGYYLMEPEKSKTGDPEHRIQFFSVKLGGTSGGWIVPNNWDTQGDPAEGPSIHSDYMITLVDTAVQPLYNYLVVNGTYHRLQRQDQGILIAPVNVFDTSKGDVTPNLKKFPYDAAEYDFSFLSEKTFKVNSKEYHYWDQSKEPTTRYFYTVDTQNPKLVVSEKLVKAEKWEDASGEWLNGATEADWGDIATKAFHRNFSVKLYDGNSSAAVTFKYSLDGESKSQEVKVKYGQKPTFDYDKYGTPNKTSDDGCVYKFYGWEDEATGIVYGKDELPAVIGKVTYNAVYKIVLTVTAADKDKTYDGSALTQSEFSVTGYPADLADEDKPKFTVVMTEDSTITNVGKTANVIATVNNVAVNTKDSVVIGDYYVLAADGTLTVKPKAVTITAKSLSKEYGNADPEFEFTTTSLESGDSHRFTVVMEREEDESTGYYELTISSVDGTSVTAGEEIAIGNYLVTAVNGAFVILYNTTSIEISSSSKSWTYDGQIHKDEVYTVKYDGTAVDADETGKVFKLPTGDTVTITATAEGVKDYDEKYSQNNTFDFAGIEKFSNVTVKTGTLSIAKRRVTLTSESGEKPYDGMSLTKSEVTIGGEGFVVGEVSDVKATGSVTTVAEGEVTNTITYMQGENFKADNYEIAKTEGKLKITQNTKKLEISSSTKSWTYDGMTHTDEVYTVKYDETEVAADETGKVFVLPTGDTVTITAATEGVKDYDESYSGNNTFTYALSNAGNYDITAISTVFGTLSIDRKEVTITASDFAKYYTGEAVTYSGFTNSPLEDGDDHVFVVTMTEDSTITEMGTQQNVIATVDGTEVTTGTEIAIGNYLVTTVEGTLTVLQGKLKTEVTASPDSNVKVGDKVTYTVVVKNCGNVAISGIKLSHLPIAETGSTAEPFDLELGAEKTLTYEYTVTQDDVDAGEFTRTSKAAGLDPGENVVEASDSVKVTTEPASADLSINVYTTSQSILSGGYQLGETVTFEVYVANTGNVTVNGVAVSVAVGQNGTAATEIVLRPGESTKQLHFRYTVTQEDMDAGTFTCTVTAVGQDPDGDELEVSASEEVVTAPAGAELAITSKADYTGILNADSVITYTVTVKNVGNVSVKDGALVDNLVDLSNETFVLAPGEEATFTYTYKVTSEDVASGVIENTVKANAKAVRGDDPEEAEAITMTLPGRKALSITSATQSWKYDGKEHRQDSYTVTYGGEDVPADDETGLIFTLETGDVLTITPTAESVQNYSENYLANNTFTYSVTNADLYERVSANYGTLSIEKRKVTLTSESAEKTFDDADLTRMIVSVDGDGFVDGEVTGLKAEGRAHDVGEVANEITYKEEDTFISGNYEITKKEGTLKITKRKVFVTIIGNTDSKPYNGDLQSVYGYKAEISASLYKEKDFRYNSDAVTGGVKVGEYTMGITPDQFENLNNNFDVTFTVKEDGKMTIEPCNSVVVTIIGRDEKVQYDGATHTISDYDIDIADRLYSQADFEFRGSSKASGRDAGSYEMQMKPEDFVNTNDNYGTVEFVVVNGTLTIEPKEVSVEWSEDREFPFDGKEHKPEAWVGNLAEGDSCEVTVDGAQTEIGKEYVATAAALSNPNYKLPDEAWVTFEIYGCTVTFVDDDDNELQSKIVPYGEIPSYEGDNPTKRSYFEAYHYEFTGWAPEFVPVAERVTTYKAQFEQVTNECTVTWVDGKGVTLKTEKLLYGAMPEYTGETPTTKEREGFIYTFVGWDPVVSEVAGDVTYTAQFSEKPVKVYFLKTSGSLGHEQGSDESMEFIVSSNYDEDTFSHFIGLTTDGKTTPEDGYTAVEGSVIINVKPEYLDQLPVGSHMIKVLFDDFEEGVEVAFDVTEKSKEDPTPKISEEPEDPTPKISEEPEDPTPKISEEPEDPTPKISEEPEDPTPKISEEPEDPTPKISEEPEDPTPKISEEPEDPTPKISEIPEDPTPKVTETPEDPTPKISEIPENPTPTGTPDDDPKPRTGDTMNMTFLAVLLGAALATMLFVYMKRREECEEED